MKYYQSEVWLYRKYIKEQRTAKEIAGLCGVTEMTIDRWLDKFNLKRKRRTLRRR